MISFELTEEQSLAQSMVREFSREVLRPAARGADEAKQVPDDVLHALWSLNLVQGLLGDDAEGEGTSILGAILLEELAWGDAIFAIALGGPLAFVRAVSEQGSAHQQASLLPLFKSERYVGASVLIDEPRFLETSRVQTRAVGAEDGFILTGAKLQVPLAGWCGHFLVIAEYDGKPDAFIVAADAPGVTVCESSGTLGLYALKLATVEFKEVRLGPDARLGGNHGCDVQRLIDSAKTASAAIMTGISRAVYEHISAYAKERTAHGQPLAQKQSVAFRIVDMFVELQAMRLMGWRAATQLDKRASSTREASLAQQYAVEQGEWITDEGVQLMGGHGFMRENPVEMWYRNAKTLSASHLASV